jgi:hypothetical protein
VDEGQRGEPGKIRQVLETIEDHPDAVTYDWRERFNLPLSSVTDGSLTWDESFALLNEIVQDPASHTCAAINKWEYAFSRESIQMADLFDLTQVINTDPKQAKNIQLKPRPWKTGRMGEHVSQKPAISQEEIRAKLRALGHEGL